MKKPFTRNTKRLKRTIFGILLLVAVGLTFSSVQISAKTTVEFWQLTTPPDNPVQKGILEIIESFEEQNPDIKIKYVQVDISDYHPKLSVTFKGGNPPDVLRLSAIYALVDFAKAGWLQPLDDLVAESEHLDRNAWYNPEFYEWNGKLYALPMLMICRRIGINKNVFKKFGLTRPTTWDELLVNAQKATQGDTYGWASVLHTTMWAVNQFGNFLVMNDADIVAPDYETVTVSEKPFMETLEFYTELNQKYTPPGVVSMTPHALGAAFATDRVAMYSMGSWWKLYNYDPSYPDFKYNEDYTSVLNPAGSERLRNLDLAPTASAIGGWAWALAANAPHPKEGWKFLEFLGRPSNRVLYNHEGPNSSTEVQLRPERWQTPWWKDYQETLRYPGKPCLRPIPGVLEVYDAVTEGVQSAILGEKSIEQIISELEAKVEEIVQKGS